MLVSYTSVSRYFSAVADDAPAFEVWPRKTEWYLHEYLLGLWGCLIGGDDLSRGESLHILAQALWRVRKNVRLKSFTGSRTRM